MIMVVPQQYHSDYSNDYNGFFFFFITNDNQRVTCEDFHTESGVCMSQIKIVEKFEENQKSQIKSTVSSCVKPVSCRLIFPRNPQVSQSHLKSY